uniref:tRNA pseudouridine(55) synthase TruB n=1 Tax=Faecalibacterium sp. TaxID=1971605 RepID=UPI0040269A28
MMQGILIVDKPTDWTSFDVIAKLRGILGTRKLGHSGTLDPMATGVLPVFCGGASKAVDLQLDHTKAYRAVLKLGARTDTGDVTGTVLETAPVTAGEKELLEVLPQFVGSQMQTPPMYSAVKINGQPLYKMARQGIEVERKARPIEIFSLEYGGSPAENEYELTVRCSKGEQHLYNGCPTSRYPAADGRYRVRNEAGQFLGLANIVGGVLKVEKLFVERN